MTDRRNLVALTVLILAILPAPVFARPHFFRADPPPHDRTAVLIEDPAGPSRPDGFPKISAEKSGTIPAKDGHSLRLNLELGNVRVFTDEHAQISYRMIVEADSRDPGAEDFLRQFSVTVHKTSRSALVDAKVPWHGLRGRFSTELEIHIPRSFNLEITSGGGNIDVQDIDGRISLASAGGNISVGRVGSGSGSERAGSEASVAKSDRLKVRSRSPQEPVLPLAARIETQGGQISIGNVAGTLRAATAGGHIIAGNVDGDAILHTGGGQIFAGRIAGVATLDSGGGNMNIESAGARVTADPAGGGLVLRHADAPLRVISRDGGITAWLSEPAASQATAHTNAQKPRELSQLTATDGDIVLYIPRQLAATIDARIEPSDGHRIFADPSLPVQISYQDSAESARTIHCAVRVNGGGEIIHLKAVSGNIVLRVSDPEMPSSTASTAGWRPGGAAPASMESVNSNVDEEFTDADGFLAEMRRRILESWWGAIPVDAEEMQKHLEHSVAPVYPDVARQAGIEGDVILRVYVSSDGRVTDLKILDGAPILARAAIEAVQQWQYQAPRMNGRPASVVTTLVLSFRLH